MPFSLAAFCQYLQNLRALLQYEEHNPLLFNSGLFLWLFLGFYGGYVLLARHTDARLLYVTAFSLFFYYKSSGILFLLLVWATGLDYVLARLIDRYEHPRPRTAMLVVSIVANLGLLFYFKYANFLVSIGDAITQSHHDPLGIVVPAGISFFTFQSLSYTIDVYKRKLKPVKSLLDYAFFVSFFPQLVMGPIVRAIDFLPQVRERVVLTREDFARATWLIMGGLFKKMVIADYVSLNLVDRIFENPRLYTGIESLFAVYGYAIQIYCDFSGYSDIAIGLALLLGIHFPINFRTPYRSTDIAEFWRRWHISLSSWLRDYLYIPLGGSRKGTLRTYINLFLTMLIGGLWHGAAWRFVLWGALHGGALAIERFVESRFRLPRNTFVRIVRWVITFHFVCFCWVFFRAHDLTLATDVLTNIATDFHPEIALAFFTGYRSVLLIVALGYVLHFTPDEWASAAERSFTKTPLLVKILLMVCLVWLLAQVKSSELQPFIYFQF